MMEKVTLDRAALAAIFAHARETHPDECCGAVVNVGGRDQVRRFTNIQGRLHAENPADFPRDATTAYTPEPRELLEVLRAADQPGTRLAFFYHSHSKNGAYFSGEDQARAMFDGDPAYPEVTYLVVSDAREPDEARAFRWNEPTHDFAEVALAITGATAKRSKPAPRKARAKKTARKKTAKKAKPAKRKKAAVARKRPAKATRARKKPKPRRVARAKPKSRRRR
jgi:proteasome lid subunit RPN8/RPN11